MKNNLKTLRRYNGKYDHVQDGKLVDCILFISEYFINGKGANQPQAEKVISALDSICENYLTISKVYRNQSQHGSDDYQPTGRYDISSKIPGALGLKLEDLAKQVDKKIKIDKLEDEKAKQIYGDLEKIDL